MLKLLLEIRTQIVQMPPDEQEYFSEKKLREIVRLQYASKQLEAFEERNPNLKTSILCPKNLHKIADLQIIASWDI